MLSQADPAVVTVTNRGGASPLLLIGDHAGRAVPRRLSGLGLAPPAMDLHIAWDIGVAGLGRLLARRLDACFLAQAYSRLVIDCNRRPGEASSIAQVSDGVVVPGNSDLDPDQAEARRLEIYQPYQDAIAEELDRRSAAGEACVLVSLHSFTPVFAGQARPWRMGVLHRGDSAFSAAVLARLQGELRDQVGDNQPYRMDETDNTVPLHVDARGIDYVELEVRQDLIAEPNGQAWAAEVIARALSAALAEAGTRQVLARGRQ